MPELPGVEGFRRVLAGHTGEPIASVSVPDPGALHGACANSKASTWPPPPGRPTGLSKPSARTPWTSPAAAPLWKAAASPAAERSGARRANRTGHSDAASAMAAILARRLLAARVAVRTVTTDAREYRRARHTNQRPTH